MTYSLSRVNQTDIMVLPVKNCFASDVGDLCKWVMNRRRWIHVKLTLTAGCSLQPSNALSLPQRQVRFPSFFLLTRLNYSSCLIQQACSPLPFPRRWAGRQCLEGPGGVWGRRRGGETAAAPRALQLRVLHRQRCPGLAGQREERMVHHPTLLPRVRPKLPPPVFPVEWAQRPGNELGEGQGRQEICCQEHWE
ncbi:uncharacterized protein ACIBXB_021555 [Morphnus guianensis]